VPPPIFSATPSGTQTTANMRLRLVPTINVSEHLRVRSQIDLLDNYVLGASPGAEFKGATPVDRPIVDVKRAWGEVDTPVGLLSVGRMPAAFGLGLVVGDPGGLDDDYGDTRDRLQFATLPLSTPIGQLALVPFLDFDAEGQLQVDQRYGPGAGQPFDLDRADDGRTWGLKFLRLDTDAELARKLEQGGSSTNYGLMYTYTTLGTVANPYYDPAALNNLRSEYYQRSEYRHELSLWARHQSPRFQVEAEVVGLTGQIADPGPYTATINWTGPKVLLSQVGGALRASYKVLPNKVTLGGEIGVASGDSAPGYGNRPTQLSPTASESGGVTQYGATEGPQYDPARQDRTIDAFRFNPGYRVDLILWREILGQVTDAWYVKPTARWDIFTGLALSGQLVYSQALSGWSTPAATATAPGSTAMGIEFDAQLDYLSEDGLAAWVQYGGLVPLGAFEGAGSLTRAHALRAGVAIKF
jgi:uncharacterized protein (TIGR04551 family)